MDRQTWVVVRAFAPAAVLLVTALLMTIPLPGLGNGTIAAAVFGWLRWAPIVMGAIALMLVALASYRLWRCERGEGPACVTCGGPLGHEREGRASRGGAYRGCYACGKNVNHRHYE